MDSCRGDGRGRTPRGGLPLAFLRVLGDDGEDIDTAKMVCVGESSADSHDLLRGHDPDEAGERDEAERFLEAELADGPRKSKEVERAFSGAARTLRRARKGLGIKARKEPLGPKGEWWWAAPDQEFPWEATSLGGQPNTPHSGHVKKTRTEPRVSGGQEALGGHASGAGQVRDGEGGGTVVWDFTGNGSGEEVAATETIPPADTPIDAAAATDAEVVEEHSAEVPVRAPSDKFRERMASVGAACVTHGDSPAPGCRYCQPSDDAEELAA
jgi:hypothetical protein